MKAVCQPCYERKRAEVPATHMVADTPFCSPCFKGEEDDSESASRRSRGAVTAKLVIGRIKAGAKKVTAYPKCDIHTFQRSVHMAAKRSNIRVKTVSDDGAVVVTRLS